MSIRYPYLGEGLLKMFWAKLVILIVTIVSSIWNFDMDLLVEPVSRIPIVIAILVLDIIYLFGLKSAGKEVRGCAIAFKLKIGEMVVASLVFFMGMDEFYGTLCLCIVAILNLLVDIYIVYSLNSIANSEHNPIEIGKITMIAMSLSVVFIIVMAVIPEDSIAGYVDDVFEVTTYGVIVILNIIVDLLAQIMYLLFLRKAGSEL